MKILLQAFKDEHLQNYSRFLEAEGYQVITANTWPGMFGEGRQPASPDLLDKIKEHSPDVIIYEPEMLSGDLVAGGRMAVLDDSEVNQKSVELYLELVRGSMDGKEIPLIALTQISPTDAEYLWLQEALGGEKVFYILQPKGQELSELIRGIVES